MFIFCSNANKEPPPSQSPVKVEMQLLRLPEDAQNQILADLKFIYGDDFELGKLSDYKDKGKAKVQNSLWKDRGQLVIQVRLLFITFS